MPAKPPSDFSRLFLHRSDCKSPIGPGIFRGRKLHPTDNEASVRARKHFSERHSVFPYFVLPVCGLQQRLPPVGVFLPLCAPLRLPPPLWLSLPAGVSVRPDGPLLRLPISRLQPCALPPPHATGIRVLPSPDRKEFPHRKNGNISLRIKSFLFPNRFCLRHFGRASSLKSKSKESQPPHRCRFRYSSIKFSCQILFSFSLLHNI